MKTKNVVTMRLINFENTQTCLQGYFKNPTLYKDLVKVFGEPNAPCDEYKTDAEWQGLVNGKVFTIYNYKDGKNYNGSEGLATEDIEKWHIGGETTGVVEELNDYFTDKIIKKK